MVAGQRRGLVVAVNKFAVVVGMVVAALVELPVVVEVLVLVAGSGIR